MAISEREQGVFTAHEQEQAELAQLREALSAEQPPLFVDAKGETIALPESMRQLMLFAVKQMEKGKRLTVTPQDDMLTTQEAADLLNFSRPYLIKLLESGEIPFTMVGTHRRLRVDDVLRYRQMDRERMHEAINEMARMAQEAGSYD